MVSHFNQKNLIIICEHFRLVVLLGTLQKITNIRKRNQVFQKKLGLSSHASICGDIPN
jgi:hypothetical protein